MELFGLEFEMSFFNMAHNDEEMNSLNMLFVFLC